MDPQQALLRRLWAVEVDTAGSIRRDQDNCSRHRRDNIDGHLNFMAQVSSIHERSNARTRGESERLVLEADHARADALARPRTWLQHRHYPHGPQSPQELQIHQTVESSDQNCIESYTGDHACRSGHY